MLPANALVHSVDVVRPAQTVNSHGNTDDDYGAAATRTTIDGWLQQEQRAETFPDGRNPLEERWLLMTNHVDVDGNDRIEWAAHPAGPMTFEVHGPPEPIYTPAGGFQHLEATLRILDG